MVRLVVVIPRSYQERALPTELCGQYARNYILSQYGLIVNKV